jgi:hypothetical protein
MMVKKIVIVGLLSFGYVGCALPKVNIETNSTLNTKVQTSDEEDTKVQTSDEEDTKVQTSVEEDTKVINQNYCTSINYRNQSSLNTLEFRPYQRGEVINLYNNRNKTIDLENKVDVNIIKNDCTAISKKEGRTFAFQNRNGLCICAYGRKRR